MPVLMHYTILQDDRKCSDGEKGGHFLDKIKQKIFFSCRGIEMAIQKNTPAF